MGSICNVWEYLRILARVDPVVPRSGWTFSYFYRRWAWIFRIFHQRTEVVYYRPRMYASKRWACFACYRLLFSPPPPSPHTHFVPSQPLSLKLKAFLQWDLYIETSKDPPSLAAQPLSLGPLLRQTPTPPSLKHVSLFLLIPLLIVSWL